MLMTNKNWHLTLTKKKTTIKQCCIYAIKRWLFKHQHRPSLKRTVALILATMSAHTGLATSLSICWDIDTLDGVSYELEVGFDAQFSQIVFQKVVTGRTPYSIDLPTEGIYHWRLQRVQGPDQAANEAIRSYTASGSFALIGPMSPDNGAVTLTWPANPTASSYYVLVRDETEHARRAETKSKRFIVERTQGYQVVEITPRTATHASEASYRLLNGLTSTDPRAPHREHQVLSNDAMQSAPTAPSEQLQPREGGQQDTLEATTDTSVDRSFRSEQEKKQDNEDEAGSALMPVSPASKEITSADKPPADASRHVRLMFGFVQDSILLSKFKELEIQDTAASLNLEFWTNLRPWLIFQGNADFHEVGGSLAPKDGEVIITYGPVIMPRSWIDLALGINLLNKVQLSQHFIPLSIMAATVELPRFPLNTAPIDLNQTRPEKTVLGLLGAGLGYNFVNEYAFVNFNVAFLFSPEQLQSTGIVDFQVARAQLTLGIMINRYLEAVLQLSSRSMQYSDCTGQRAQCLAAGRSGMRSLENSLALGVGFRI